MYSLPLVLPVVWLLDLWCGADLRFSVKAGLPQRWGSLRRCLVSGYCGHRWFFRSFCEQTPIHLSPSAPHPSGNAAQTQCFHCRLHSGDHLILLYLCCYWLHGLFSSGSEWRLLSSYSAQASHCAGFFRCGARAPGVGYGRISEKSRKSMRDGAAL